VRREQALPSDSVLLLDAPMRSVTEPPSRADDDEQRQWLRLAVELLDPDDRHAIRGRDWDGLSFPELGERLGIGEEAARERYQRALPKLAKKLDQLRRGQWHAESS
jgi:RNA polymerase sigma factor (sigma-70 family)